jgi:hypothetical protein
VVKDKVDIVVDTKGITQDQIITLNHNQRIHELKQEELGELKKNSLMIKNQVKIQINQMIKKIQIKEN